MSTENDRTRQTDYPWWRYEDNNTDYRQYSDREAEAHQNYYTDFAAPDCDRESRQTWRYQRRTDYTVPWESSCDISNTHSHYDVGSKIPTITGHIGPQHDYNFHQQRHSENCLNVTIDQRQLPDHDRTHEVAGPCEDDYHIPDCPQRNQHTDEATHSLHTCLPPDRVDRSQKETRVQGTQTSCEDTTFLVTATNDAQRETQQGELQTRPENHLQSEQPTPKEHTPLDGVMQPEVTPPTNEKSLAEEDKPDSVQQENPDHLENRQNDTLRKRPESNTRTAETDDLSYADAVKSPPNQHAPSAADSQRGTQDDPTDPVRQTRTKSPPAQRKGTSKTRQKENSTTVSHTTRTRSQSGSTRQISLDSAWHTPQNKTQK